MKKYILFIATVIASTSFLKSQILYGDTYLGGNNGVLFNYNTATGKDSVNFSFNGANGVNPYYLSGLIQATDGMLYGTASGGGLNSYGVMYRFNPLTGQDTVLINFDGTLHGSAPYGSLMQANDGLIYGMTNAGGTSGDGVLYSFDPVKLKDSVRLTFDNSVGKGGYPYGSLMQAKDGFIYGMNMGGGAHGMGVLFKFNPVNNKDTALYSFVSSSSGPRGGLIQGTDGLLYGLTLHGGTSDDGTIFSYDPVKLKDSIRVSMDGTKGYYPWGNLVQAANGKMYGLTYNDAINNGGVLFCFNPVTNDDSVVLFLKSTTGIHPYGSPIIASNGLIYVLTFGGGVNNYGTMLSYNPLNGKDSVLINFNFTAIGAEPAGTLLEVKAQPLAVNNIAPQNNFTVYPNPFNNTTNIVFAEDGKHNIEVDDITGRKIENIECTGKQYELSRTGLTAGIYFVRAYDEGMEYVATAKVVVQ